MPWKFNPFTGRFDFFEAATGGSTPTGPAGGDLSGSYPDPSVVDDSHDHTAATLPSTIVYDGDAAGGDLSGTYPNPSVVNDSHAHTASTLPATIVYDGDAAGGDLSGTYPNPSVVDDSHAHTASTLPATVVYDGDAAGGDLAGTYPNPTVVDANIDHGSIGGLTDDDHTQYALLAGRAGGQQLIGGLASGDQLLLSSDNGVLVLGAAFAVGLVAGQTPVGHFHADQTGGGSSVINTETHSNVAGDSAILLFRRSRGTHTLPTAVLTSDTLCTFAMMARGATAWFDAFSVETYAAEDWSDTKQGAVSKFFTTRLGTTGVFSFMESRTDGGIFFPGPVAIFGNTGTTTTMQVGLGAGGSEAATMRIQSGLTGLASLNLNVGGTDFAFWATDGANTAFAYVGSMIFSSGLGGPARLTVTAAGNLTAVGSSHAFGTAGTAATVTVGQGTTGTDQGTLRVRSGSSGATLSAIVLSRNTTDLSYWFTDGTNTTFNSQGTLSLQVGAVTKLTLNSSGNLAQVGLFTTYNNIALEGYGLPAIHDSETRTAQGADIADTNFANAGVAGLYRVSYYLVCSTADATAGPVTLNIKFNDGTAARTLSSAAVILTATTGFAQGVIFARLGSGNITYGTTHTGAYNAGRYGLYMICERLT